MAIFFKPGDLVEIRFSAKHRKEYPAYSKLYHGAIGFVVQLRGTTFVTVTISDGKGKADICVEREFLISRHIRPSMGKLSLVSHRKAAS